MPPRPPSGGSRGPSPRNDASRRNRGWDDEPEPRARRRADPDDAPWLDEGEHDEDGPTHTLVGRRLFWGMIALLAILAIGIIVGILLVSGRDSTPIDVPAVGEEIPVLSAPGPWKEKPTGPNVDGIPVEGQGQVLFGTGNGRDPQAEIDLGAMPEDPLPRPVAEPENVMPADMDEVQAVVEQVTPPTRPSRQVQPKMIEAPAPAAHGSSLQLGAFSSESRARAAFKSLAERYRYLDGLEPLILPVVSDGKTLYRLRTSAGSAAEAREICGKLRVAGEACSVVS